MPAEFANILVGAIALGCVFGLVGVGFVILYRSTGVMSFVQGEFMLLGGFVFYSLTSTAHLSLIPALVVAIVAVGLAGVLSYLVVFSRVYDSEAFAVSVATIGLGSLLLAIMSLVWGSNTLQLPNVVSFTPIHLALNFTINSVFIVTVVLAVVIIALLILGIKKTRLGLKMQAIADAPGLVVYLGVNVVSLSALAWGLSAATAAAAGIAYSLSTVVSPANLPPLGFLAFPAILLGGLDSIGGALVGGLILALAEAAGTTLFGGIWEDMVGYGLLFAVLIVRPQGLFGARQVVRV